MLNVLFFQLICISSQVSVVVFIIGNLDYFIELSKLYEMKHQVVRSGRSKRHTEDFTLLCGA